MTKATPGVWSKVHHGAAVIAWAVFLSAFLGCKKQQPSTFQGYTEGDYLYMAAPMGGIVATVDVHDGDQVTSGQTLFSMDGEPEQQLYAAAKMKLEQGQALLEDERLGMRPSEIASIEAQLKQAEASLQLSYKTFERQKTLYEQKSISAEELDRARATAQQDQQRVSGLKAQLITAKAGARENQVAAAEANVKALAAALAQAQWNMDQTIQRAPQAATVFDTYFRPGEFVAAGRPVLSLLPPSNIRVRAFVQERVVGLVQLRTSATVSVDGAGAMSGRVSYISPSAEFTPPVIYSRDMRQKLSFMVEISFSAADGARLHPGQPVDVQIEGVTP